MDAAVIRCGLTDIHGYTDMETLTVALGERSYPIHIGAGLIERAELIASRLPQQRVAIVTNTTVAPLYLESLLLEAILARDLHVVVGATLLSCLFLVVGNLLADLLLYAADPRIREGT